jgi:hypothetical protein
MIPTYEIDGGRFKGTHDINEQLRRYPELKSNIARHNNSQTASFDMPTPPPNQSCLAKPAAFLPHHQGDVHLSGRPPLPPASLSIKALLRHNCLPRSLPTTATNIQDLFRFCYAILAILLSGNRIRFPIIRGNVLA